MGIRGVLIHGAAMVTRFGCGVVWARAQSCAGKGESFSIERREKSAKPIEINVCTIKLCGKRHSAICNLFRHISIGTAGRKMETSRNKG
jgi:hypothetical protein